MNTTTIPSADEIRAQIKARVAEVRALRRMLCLASAAEAVREARAGQRPLDSLKAPVRQEGENG
jgi:hypothetical protein